MNCKLVTAIDSGYLPGLKALNNSIRRNSPDNSLAVMVYGDDELVDEVSDLGVDVIPNPEIKASLPVTSRWPVASSAMYARLLIPSLMGCDAVWLDADQIVLKPLDQLFHLNMQDCPCAAVPSHPMQITLGGCPPELAEIDGIYSGLMAINHNNWTKKRITEQCFEVMNNSGMDFYFVVQSVLDFVLRGDFYRLPEKWQWFTNRTGTKQAANSVVAHWHGPKNPWTHDTPHGDLWASYQ